jgi:hypothetical protein
MWRQLNRHLHGAEPDLVLFALRVAGFRFLADKENACEF